MNLLLCGRNILKIEHNIFCSEEKRGINMSNNYGLKLSGYDYLGKQGQEGIRYAWKYANKPYLVESASFQQKSKIPICNTDMEICGYTTSVNSGCILRPIGLSCRFCCTGNKLPFGGILTAKDIAKQNVLMVLMDMASDNIRRKNNAREFAYMGQGEPGYSYPQIRKAINLTNLAMDCLGQKVHRHLISTSGIIEMIDAYKDDLRNNYFTSRVTMHYSLHAFANREQIMPIEKLYPCKDVLNSLNHIRELSGEKPCIGIIMFKSYRDSKNTDMNFTNNIFTMEEIAQNLDPERVRISLCEFNNTDIGYGEKLTKKEWEIYIKLFKEKGFEVKFFSSFGHDKNSACGMLGGKEPDIKIDEIAEKIECEAENLINKCMDRVS